MPNIKSAEKKDRQDKNRKARNESYKGKIETVMKSVKKGVKGKKGDLLNKAYSVIDKAAKKNVIHKNKAARMKSRVSRLVGAK
jgi:small subunit ribosomal protein S20